MAKRLKTGLLKIAKTHKLGGKKFGSLTVPTITKLQRYYGNAIRNNKNNLNNMKTAILATLYHCSSTDDKPQHTKCPALPDSWCFYNRAIALGKQTGSHTKNVHTPLSIQVLTKIIPVYQRLASNALLERCLEGRTQNFNESLHSMIWNRCPKHKSASKRKVEIAVASAVTEFNFGYCHMMSKTLISGGISPGSKISTISRTKDASCDQRRNFDGTVGKSILPKPGKKKLSSRKRDAVTLQVHSDQVRTLFLR